MVFQSNDDSFIVKRLHQLQAEIKHLMCGIAGICTLVGSKRISAESIIRMAGALNHRGPDETGIYLDDSIGLGHTRLSIIDLSGGSQPIHNEDETLWIIYNGEIFNYLELKEDLIKRGHRFYTSSDTEVILHLFEEKGPSCLRQLNGQFALAIWNSKSKELFLARDRMGIRPLHYIVHDHRIIFASEIKAIFMNEEVPRRIDPIAIDQIFTFWTTLPGRTVFQGIQELLPGHFLVVRNGEISIRKYWDIPFSQPGEQLDWPVERICEEIQGLLHDAIRVRLRADVPVGCYLSGGLDSSGITSLVKNKFNNRLRTFGIRFEQGEFDESKYQDCMIDVLKTDHTNLQVTNENIGAVFSDVIWHCEKPILRTAPAPLFMLSKTVRDNGFKVVLTGEGADEVFGGYNIFRETLVRKFWARQPASRLRPLLIGKLYPYIFNDPRLKTTLQAFFRERDGKYRRSFLFASDPLGKYEQGKGVFFRRPEGGHRTVFRIRGTESEPAGNVRPVGLLVEGAIPGNAGVHEQLPSFLARRQGGDGPLRGDPASLSRLPYYRVHGPHSPEIEDPWIEREGPSEESLQGSIAGSDPESAKAPLPCTDTAKSVERKCGRLGGFPVPRVIGSSRFV